MTWPDTRKQEHCRASIGHAGSKGGLCLARLPDALGFLEQLFRRGQTWTAISKVGCFKVSDIEIAQYLAIFRL
jgi:hypothetical protein